MLGVLALGVIGFMIRVIFWIVNLAPVVGSKLSEQKPKMQIYAVRTTSGQENTVAYLLTARVALKKLPIVSILAPEIIKGYIFIEGAGPHFVDEAIAGVKHARARTKGVITVQPWKDLSYLNL